MIPKVEKAVPFLFTLFLIVSAALAQTAGDLYSTDNIVGKMRYVPAGIFTQGSPANEPGRNSDEDQFTHLLTKNIAVMEIGVTLQMWTDLRALQPALPEDRLPEWFGPSTPLTWVTWKEALLFANLLSIQNGFAPCYYKDSRFTVLLNADNYGTGSYFVNPAANGYRLPTEGEREYFTRAGTTGPFSIDEPNYTGETYESCTAGALPALETVAWFCANCGGLAPVGGKSPNPWNLKGIHGNLFDWCWDIYGPYPTSNAVDSLGASSGLLRVIKGGSCLLNASYSRSAFRHGRTTYFNSYDVGFRLVRTINPAPGPSVNVTSPAGGDIWWVGSSHWITWTTSGEIDYVAIDYSTDNGISWLPIVNSTSNVGEYAWNMPGTSSSACFIRVSDAANATVSGTCAANFSIIPVPPPVIDLSRPALEFFAGNGQAVVPPQWITVRNSSGGSLSWSASPSEGWISVNPSSGNDGAQIEISVKTSALDPGIYHAPIEFSDPQATNSPKLIYVDLTISASADEPYFTVEHYNWEPFSDGRSIATMDFDGDGDQDIVLCDSHGGPTGWFIANSHIFALRNEGNGSFVDVSDDVFIGSRFTVCGFLIPGDFNGDGREDLFHIDGGGDGAATGQDLIFIQTADGQLRNETEGRLPIMGSVAGWAGDIDGDGDLDVLHMGTYQSYFGPLFLINDGTGHFTVAHGRLPLGLGFKNLACGFIDYDKDGDLDLFFGQDGNRNIMLINDGTGHYSQAPEETFPPTLFGGATMHCTVADFNADGWPDIAAPVLTYDGQGPGIQLFLNNADGTFRDESDNVPFAVGIGGWINQGDINDDGWMDILCCGLVYVNQGGAHFIEVSDELIPRYAEQNFAAADLNNDGHTDIYSLVPGIVMEVYRNVRPFGLATPLPYPDAPILATPSDGSMVGTSSPTLGWNSVSTAIDYELEVAIEDSFASPLITLTGITPTSAQVGPLENDTTYYWRIRARNARGLGPWSAVFDFSVSPITIIAPDGGENWPIGTTHDIIWSSKGVTGNVTIELYRSEEFHSTIGQADAAAGHYSWAIPSGLPEGNDYKVRVYQGTDSDLSDAAFSTYKEGIISGHITACGSPVADVILGGLPGNPETDASGFYSISVPYGWSGTVTPSRLSGGYFFEPAYVTYSNVKTDQTSDYKGYKGIPPREREILIALYKSTNGASWPEYAREGWKTPPLEGDGFGADGTEGSWFGIVVSNHRVTQLTASVYNLSPAPVIPPVLGELTGLVNLQLYNGYTGVIPSELSNLANLNILFIEGNSLTGSIPPSFVNLKNLGWLELGGNQLSGSIPVFLGSMNIGWLNLGGNQFSGAIPAELSNLTYLDTLMLDCNQLSGEIPASLANLTPKLPVEIFRALIFRCTGQS